MFYFKNDEEKQLNQEIMKRMDGMFDETECMIRQWRGENGYHSQIVNQYVHPTRDSLAYAYELFNCDRPGDRKRAIDILYRVVPLQDKNSDNKTYGIWSYYAEETLAQMAPPDWNWADFCGKTLLQIFAEYAAILPDDLKKAVEEAILHACNSIIRRNMGPYYTNISIMGTLVTMAAGELFQKEYLTEYAKERLVVLYEFNMGHGAFQEYNSPSYTWVVIDDIAAMSKLIHDKDSLHMFYDLTNLAWQCIAEHFHYRTRQWAGPHSRFYAMLEDDELLMRVQRSLNYKINLVSLKKKNLSDSLPMGFFSFDSNCPAKYQDYFTQPNKDRAVDAVFVHSKIPQRNEIAVCRLQEAYTLGTFYKSTFWNQKRSHISYYGTQKQPVYCSLKCLHDGYDYASGTIVTSQDGMKAVSVLGFATDGGDTHCNLDLIQNASIQAEDLRFRFEFGGALETVSFSQPDDRSFLVKLLGAKVRVVVAYASFGEYPVTCQLTDVKEHANETGDHKQVGHIVGLDIVLYHGKKKTICFRDFEKCSTAVSFEIIPDNAEFSTTPKAYVQDGMLIVEQENRIASAPVCACTLQQMVDQSRAYRAKEEYTEIYADQKE